MMIKYTECKLYNWAKFKRTKTNFVPKVPEHDYFMKL